MIKRPNLSNNYYFPFYTQSIIGKKKYLYYVNSYMHLSDSKAIGVEVRRMKNKIDKINLKFIDTTKTLYTHKKEYKKICYDDFALTIKHFYNALSSALRELASEPAYRKTLIYSSIVKFNSRLELEFDWQEISVQLKNSDYKIEQGKIVRLKENPFTNSDSEAVKKWEAIGKAFDEKTEYKNITKEEFEERLNDCWERYLELFEAPKTIRKKEYTPK